MIGIADQLPALEIELQLAAILHAPEFQKLKASWRGLNYLVIVSRDASKFHPLVA